MFVKKSFSSIFSVLFIIVFTLSVTPLQSVHAAGVLYAKPAASGSGNCSSWVNACTLQTALTDAVSGIEIWAAVGTHKPTTNPSNRDATFQLKNGVAVYGGFAGSEASRSQRNPAANGTILSGDLLGDDVGFNNNSENIYHVVTGATGATLDGFTVKAGNANGISPNNSGGGMYNKISSPALTDITFSSNSATSNGGGMDNETSVPRLMNVTFNGNSATISGGGMYNSSSNPTLTNITFSSNTADSGGGMYNTGSSPTMADATFSGNSATTNGGGMYNTGSSDPTLVNVIFSGNSATTNSGGGMYNYRSHPILLKVIFSGNTAYLNGGGMANLWYDSPTMTDVTFSNNSATYTTSNGGGMYNYVGTPILTNVTFSGNWVLTNGGGMYNYNSAPTLTNVTFSGNTAYIDGGGMYNNSYSSPTSTNVTFSGNTAYHNGGGMYNTAFSNFQIRDTIFWDNTAVNTGAQIYNNSSTPALSYSVIQDGCPAGSTCTNIFSSDPLIGTLGNYGGFTQTIPLLAGSSAIDTGNNTTCATTDQRGVARPQSAHCDIGSYELDTTAPLVNSITRFNPSPTNLANVDFTVTFSEAVPGVDKNDFALSTTGISGATITAVSLGPAIYTVSVNTGTGNGTIRLDVPATATINDIALNPLASLPYTGGEMYTITKGYKIFLPFARR